MDRLNSPSIIQREVELHDISSSPSVEMSRLLTPSLPDDKLQSEISLDFDSSCNAHDSVLGSSLLGREADVSMVEDECLDLSVTPSFETGLSDYAPTCFDSGTITHSIHTQPVCAVSESVSSLVGKEADSVRNQQNSVELGSQILSTTPIILGSSSAASFVNAVLENLTSRSAGGFAPTQSIFSVAPGIFILNTLGAPGIIDLPLKTVPLSAESGSYISSMSHVSSSIGHGNFQAQLVENRDSVKLKTLLSPNIIKLEIRTVPVSEQIPVLSNIDSSAVLLSGLNIPVPATPEDFSENKTIANEYITLEGNLTMPACADSMVQLEDSHLSLEQQTDKQKEADMDITEILGSTNKSMQSNINNNFNNEKASQTPVNIGNTLGNRDLFKPVVKKEINLQTVESQSSDFSVPVLVSTVDNGLWSGINRFCTFPDRNDKNSQDNQLSAFVQSSSTGKDDSLNGQIINQECIKSAGKLLTSGSQEKSLNSGSVVETSEIVTCSNNNNYNANKLVNLTKVAGTAQNSELAIDRKGGNSVSFPMTNLASMSCEVKDIGQSQQVIMGQGFGSLPSSVSQEANNSVVSKEECKKDCEDNRKFKAESSFHNYKDQSRVNSSQTGGTSLQIINQVNQVDRTSLQTNCQVDQIGRTSLKTCTKESPPNMTEKECHMIKDKHNPGTSVQVESGVTKDGELVLSEHEETEQGSEHGPEQSLSECELCNATFTRPGNYKRHLKLHDFNHWNNSRYKCEKCGRSFLQHCDLKRHLLIHENKEPYKCSVCGKGYIRKSDLVVHLRFHNKEKVFKCDQCSKSYYQNGDLKRHLRTHTRQELLICAYCGRKLARQTTLLQHMQTKHKDIIIETFQSVEKNKQNEDHRM